MKTLRTIIDRPETLAIPFVRWMESHKLMTMELIAAMVTIATFLELAA